MVWKGKRPRPNDDCSDGLRAIWLKVFTYARNDCRANKRQAERIAQATIEALQINLVLFGPADLGRRRSGGIKQS